MAFWGFGVLFFLDFGTQACKITFTGIRNGWVRNRTGHKFPKKKNIPTKSGSIPENRKNRYQNHGISTAEN